MGAINLVVSSHRLPAFGRFLLLGVGTGLALLPAVAGRLEAQTAAIPATESLEPPSARRLAAIHASAQRDGWAPQFAMLRATAFQAYEKEKWLAAEAWYLRFRWAGLFGERVEDFIKRWVPAINQARVGHPNMPSEYRLEARPLGSLIRPELQAWLFGDGAFSQEFFALLSPLDYLPNVLKILDDLHASGPARFKAHANLALAIAVVHDVPPPPSWPHAQASASALRRRFADPVEAFAWWIRQEELGRTHHRLARLRAEELKFVVDAIAPFAELEWSLGIPNLNLPSLPRAYSLVRYRADRVASNSPVWPGATYRLQEILAAGGICADQAYFATQVGKARGVPTLFFAGSGDNGRHAWFGFLDGNRQWQLDAGRYADQRLITGYARDPQTWLELSDHELQFLSERFRGLASFQQARLHTRFAAEYLAEGRTPAAAAAARRAVGFERRHQEGWELLLAAARTQGRDARTLENVCREAAIAFQRYPDLEAHYVRRVSESLRARGETSAADAEVARLALKNKANRADLSVQLAADKVMRAIATEPLAGQIRSYQSAVDAHGRGAGLVFFDQVVRVFVEHLLRLGHPAEAGQALERARRIMKVEPNTQLEGEFARLRQETKAPAR